MPLLEVADVSVRFGGHMAVDGASVHANAGAITGLIGPNGAGKTTLFNVICGLQTPTRGTVAIDGVDVTHQSTHLRARRGLARTFQRLELFGSLTVLENLQVAAEVGAWRRRGRGRTPAQRVDAALGLCGLVELADRRADVITTGQARLVELARALVTEPTLLLLDEPASGLDSAETDGFGELLVRLAGDGLAILLVEHDVSLVMRVCDELAVLDYGRVIASGPPDVIRRDPAVIAAYLGVPTADADT